jgi:hypothetical protein
MPGGQDSRCDHGHGRGQSPSHVRGRSHGRDDGHACHTITLTVTDSGSDSGVTSGFFFPAAAHTELGQWMGWVDCHGVCGWSARSQCGLASSIRARHRDSGRPSPASQLEIVLSPANAWMPDPLLYSGWKTASSESEDFKIVDPCNSDDPQ